MMNCFYYVTLPHKVNFISSYPYEDELRIDLYLTPKKVNCWGAFYPKKWWQNSKSYQKVISESGFILLHKNPKRFILQLYPLVEPTHSFIPLPLFRYLLKYDPHQLMHRSLSIHTKAKIPQSIVELVNYSVGYRPVEFKIGMIPFCKRNPNIKPLKR